MVRQRIVRLDLPSMGPNEKRQEVTELLATDLREGWTIKAITAIPEGGMSNNGDLVVLLEKSI